MNNSDLTAKTPYIGPNTIHAFPRRAGERWTATEDCWLCGYIVYSPEMGGYNPYVTIDNIFASLAYSDNGVMYAPVCAPVKKGQIVRTFITKPSYTPSFDVYNITAQTF